MLVTNIIFFLFQAEDDIRDVAVTGVQTCALPISITYHRPGVKGRKIWGDPLPEQTSKVSGEATLDNQNERPEIGRASCRERMLNSIVGVYLINNFFIHILHISNLILNFHSHYI